MNENQPTKEENQIIINEYRSLIRGINNKINTTEKKTY